ncbi:MAG TPA: hypothetical protein ENH29_04190 [Bacteroidetes bacterium]|nr:hypothetical protein [Bacteroidota bacterium]
MIGLSPAVQKNRNRFDLIIFDIDGILIDTGRSFPMAIMQSIAKYGELAGIPDLEQPSQQDIAMFKTVPGFNNDWDLDEGLLLFFLQQNILPVPLDLTTFIAETAKAGTGLEGIKNWLFTLPSIFYQKIFSRYRPHLIRKLAMEYYAGEQYCEYLYGIKPEFGVKSGALQAEKVLVDCELFRRISQTHTIGFYSGRNEREFELVKPKIGAENIANQFIVYAATGRPAKPDPIPLLNMARLCNADGIIFIGDSFDDYQTVINFNRYYPEIQCEFVQVINRGKPFAGDISIVENVNQLLHFLEEDK